MKQINPILAGLLFMAASPAFAQGNKPMATVPVKDAAAADSISVPSALSYTYAELGYTQLTYDESDVKADGFGISGSFALDKIIGLPLYATGGYTMLETEKVAGGSVEVTDLYVGAGYRFTLSEALDLNTELEILKADLKGKGNFAGAKANDTGFRLGVGARMQIAPQFELGGGVAYEDIGEESETILGINGLYHIAQGFSAIVNVSTSSDATGFGIAGRYNFAL